MVQQVSCSWAKVVSEAEFLSIQVISGSWIANVNLRAYTSRFGISDLFCTFLGRKHARLLSPLRTARPVREAQ